MHAIVRSGLGGRYCWFRARQVSPFPLPPSLARCFAESEKGRREGARSIVFIDRLSGGKMKWKIRAVVITSKSNQINRTELIFNHLP